MPAGSPCEDASAVIFLVPPISESVLTADEGDLEGASSPQFGGEDKVETDGEPLFFSDQWETSRVLS